MKFFAFLLGLLRGSVVAHKESVPEAYLNGGVPDGPPGIGGGSC